MGRTFSYFLLVILTFSFSMVGQASLDSFDGTYYGLSCDGTWENDEMAAYCQFMGYQNRIQDVGVRQIYLSFETVSEELSANIEADYDMVLLINAEEGTTPKGALIPSQHMMVLKKKSGQKKMFKRNARGVITGIAKGVQQASSIAGGNVQGNGKIIKYGGLEMVPVSTGAPWHMLSFSGIYQVNWGRSSTNHRSSYGAPMSNQFYFGYFYHRRGTPEHRWTNNRRERVSYGAVHGTPKKNWKFLGKKRDSHGCTRVHPSLQEGFKKAALSLPTKNVWNFDWDYPLPVQDPAEPFKKTKPVLLMVFDGYDSVGA